MTFAEDIGDASKAKWQRRELADEIARAAIAAAKRDVWHHMPKRVQDFVYGQNCTREIFFQALGYARGYLDARRP